MQLGFLAVTADPETPKACSACSFQSLRTHYQSKFQLVPPSHSSCPQQGGIPAWFGFVFFPPVLAFPRNHDVKSVIKERFIPW